MTRTAFVLVALLLGSAAVYAADNGGTGLWMAAASGEASVSGQHWGRLILKDDRLAFVANDSEWSVHVSEIKRLEVSKVSDRLFEVETYGGDTYYIAILSPLLLVESPREAVQVIHRAMRPHAVRGR
jgi:hypothetical protein